jgi:hypothetical protein
MTRRWLMMLAVLVLLPRAPAAAQDLHLTQQVEVLQNGSPVLRESRDLSLRGTAILMKNPSRGLLIRPDLGKAYLFDPSRALLGEIPMAQLTPEMAGGPPGGPLPPIQPTGETRTVQGLHCEVYQSTMQALSVEVCVTRELTVLERVQGQLGIKADLPGVPVEYVIQVNRPGAGGLLTIRQRLTKVDRTSQDPALFAVPTGKGARP